MTTSIGGSNVLVNDSAVVNNAGVFRLGDIISLNSGTGTFNNTGTLEVNGGGIATVSSVTLNNTGYPMVRQAREMIDLLPALELPSAIAFLEFLRAKTEKNQAE